MSGFASWLAALILAQGEPSPAAERPTEAETPAQAPAPVSSTPAPAAIPAPAPRPARHPAGTSTSRSNSTSTPTPTATPTPTPTSTPTSTPSATSTPTADPGAPGLGPRASGGRPDATRRAGASPEARSPRPEARIPAPTAPPGSGSTERDQAVRAARAFLDALASGDADALAAACSDRFSFDGETQSGREAVRRAWRGLLAGRPGPAPKVNGLEVLPAPDAVARLGKPPARIAPLARAGVWIAIGDVGGRPVVLFVGREGGRLAVLGMHD